MKKFINIMIIIIILISASVNAYAISDEIKNSGQIPEEVIKYAESQLPSFAFHYMPPAGMPGLDISHVKLGEGYLCYKFENVYAKGFIENPAIDDMIKPVRYIFQIYSANDIPIGYLTVSEELHAAESSDSNPTETINELKKIAEEQLGVTVENKDIKFIMVYHFYTGIAIQANDRIYFVSKTFENTEVRELFENENVFTAEEMYNYVYHYNKVGQEEFEKNGEATIGGVPIKKIKKSMGIEVSEAVSIPVQGQVNQSWVRKNQIFIYSAILITLVGISIIIIKRRKKKINH